MSYLVWKVIHIILVILFLGNIITGLFWAHYAHRTRNFEFIGRIFRGIIISDRIFTLPGVIGIVTSGIVSAVMGKYPLLGTGWIFWSIILFSISGILFMWLAPLQKRISRHVEENSMSEESWSKYSRMFHRWDLFGIMAILTPLAALLLMVMKLELPAL